MTKMNSQEIAMHCIVFFLLAAGIGMSGLGLEIIVYSGSSLASFPIWGLAYVVTGGCLFVSAFCFAIWHELHKIRKLKEQEK